MKKQSIHAMLAVILAFGMVSVGCKSNAVKNGEEAYFFNAKILEIRGNYVLVEPLEGEAIRSSGERVEFRINHLEKIGVSVGHIVTIQYTGTVREKYPVDIDALSWTIYE